MQSPSTPTAPHTSSLPQYGVQPEFWSSAGCPDPTISPMCLCHWNKERLKMWGKTARTHMFRKVVEIQKIQNVPQHITEQLLRHWILQAMQEWSIAIQRRCKKVSSKSLKTASSSGFSCKPPCHTASFLTYLGWEQYSLLRVRTLRAKYWSILKLPLKPSSPFAMCAMPVHWPGYKKSRFLHFEQWFGAAPPNGELQLFQSFKDPTGLDLLKNTFLVMLCYPNTTRAPKKSNFNIYTDSVSTTYNN